MSKINWDQKFSIAIPDMDDQHKLWIDLINELHESLINTSTADALNQALIHAVDYTVFHFREEEELMQNVGYPAYHQHMIAHYNFANQMKKLRDDCSAGELVLCTEVMSHLMTWLVDHIMSLDKEYADFINLRDVKAEA